MSFSGDGRTPLHLAVLKGQVEVTSELVRCRPEVIRFRLDQGKTLVHLAVKQNRLGALKLLFELGREDDDDLVSVKNDHGNTILHIAAGFKQTEVNICYNFYISIMKIKSKLIFYCCLFYVFFLLIFVPFFLF